MTGGTLFHIARQYGYTPDAETDRYDIHNLLLDEIIIDPSFVRAESPECPESYDPKGEMLEYFKTLFRAR